MKGFIPPLASLQKQLEPLSQSAGLPVFAAHAHEVLLSFLLYSVIFEYVAPALSAAYVPSYRSFDRKTTVKWNMQCVSMVQSIVICSMSLYVIFNDEERAAMDAAERVWGFTGAGASVQAFAMGYFIWDLGSAVLHLKYVGVPVLLHAISCCAVYALGFQPIFNYHGSIFVLYELSTPFLNIHMFLHQLGLTGSNLQLYNGIIFTAVFFGCRIAYGWYASFVWYMDIWSALDFVRSSRSKKFPVTPFGVNDRLDSWVVGVYTLSNLTLNTLNVIWMSQMVKTFINREKKGSKKTNRLANEGTLDSQMTEKVIEKMH